MTAFKQDQDGILILLETPDDGQRNCPKHVGFLDKNKFWKLVRLLAYYKEICYDARSHEHKSCSTVS
jgi:hypothetical protein